jgi:hypothetical protein
MPSANNNFYDADQQIGSATFLNVRQRFPILAARDVVTRRRVGAFLHRYPGFTCGAAGMEQPKVSPRPGLRAAAQSVVNLQQKTGSRHEPNHHRNPTRRGHDGRLLVCHALAGPPLRESRLASAQTHRILGERGWSNGAPARANGDFPSPSLTRRLARKSLPPRVAMSSSPPGSV